MRGGSREIEIVVRCVIDGNRSILPYTAFFEQKMNEALAHSPPDKVQLTLFYPRIIAARLVEEKAE